MFFSKGFLGTDAPLYMDIATIYFAILPFLLAFAAGAMIYVVVEELIPESQTNKSKDLMAIFTILGFAVMMFLDVFFG